MTRTTQVLLAECKLWPHRPVLSANKGNCTMSNYGATMPERQRDGRHGLSARIMELLHKLSGNNDVALTWLSMKITGSLIWLSPLYQSMGDIFRYCCTQSWFILFFEVSWGYLVCCSLVVFNLKKWKVPSLLQFIKLQADTQEVMIDRWHISLDFRNRNKCPSHWFYPPWRTPTVALNCQRRPPWNYKIRSGSAGGEESHELWNHLVDRS